MRPRFQIAFGIFLFVCGVGLWLRFLYATFYLISNNRMNLAELQHELSQAPSLNVLRVVVGFLQGVGMILLPFWGWEQVSEGRFRLRFEK